ncbi:uncharacterized protein METZ01_LOCUS399136, partial [marine metagenome]
KVSIDTSDLAPQQLLDTFFKKSNAHFNTRDALRLLDQKYAQNP